MDLAIRIGAGDEARVGRDLLRRRAAREEAELRAASAKVGTSFSQPAMTMSVFGSVLTRSPLPSFVTSITCRSRR